MAPLYEISHLVRCQFWFMTQTRRFVGSFQRKGMADKWEKEMESTSKRKVTFIDSLRVYVRGGAGGQGLPKYGGIGGEGGDIVIFAKNEERLANIRDKYPKKRFVAGSGQDSTKFCLCGQRGSDVQISVPTGVEVITDEGEVIGDLNKVGDKVIAASGGKGGNLETKFIGQRGETRSVCLNLKLIADVGLVGFPNAGKSTFLKAVSRANPKIANYPFTTVRPQIGIAEFPDFRKISVADLPGLIEGAHANFGMGHKFLKHVERTKLLLFMVDLNGFQLAQGYVKRSAFQTVILLNRELELYRPDLLSKPAVLVVNKTDTDPDGRLAQELMSYMKELPNSMDLIEKELQPDTLIKFDDILTISAKNCENTSQVMEKVRALLDIYADRQLSELQQDKTVMLDDDDRDTMMRKHKEHAQKRFV